MNFFYSSLNILRLVLIHFPFESNREEKNKKLFAWLRMGIGEEKTPRLAFNSIEDLLIFDGSQVSIDNETIIRARFKSETKKKIHLHLNSRINYPELNVDARLNCDRHGVSPPPILLRISKGGLVI